MIAVPSYSASYAPKYISSFRSCNPAERSRSENHLQMPQNTMEVPQPQRKRSQKPNNDIKNICFTVKITRIDENHDRA